MRKEEKMEQKRIKKRYRDREQKKVWKEKTRNRRGAIQDKWDGGKKKCW
jgi:hypothetical protein